MNAPEETAWKAFLEWIAQARPALDGCVPVALICLPVEGFDEDGAAQVAREGRFRILWPADFPVAERGLLLRKLALPYAAGTDVR